VPRLNTEKKYLCLPVLAAERAGLRRRLHERLVDRQRDLPRSHRRLREQL